MNLLGLAGGSCTSDSSCGVTSSHTSSEVCAWFFWGVGCYFCHNFIDDSGNFTDFSTDLLAKYPSLKIKQMSVADVTQGNWSQYNSIVKPLLNANTFYLPDGSGTLRMENYKHGLPTLIIGDKVMNNPKLIKENAESVINSYLSKGVKCADLGVGDSAAAESSKAAEDSYSPGKSLAVYDTSGPGFQWEAQIADTENMDDYFAVYYVVYCTEPTTTIFGGGTTNMPVSCGLGTGKKGSNFSLQKQQPFSCKAKTWGTISLFDGSESDIIRLYGAYKDGGCLRTILINSVESKVYPPLGKIVQGTITVTGGLNGSQAEIFVTQSPS